MLKIRKMLVVALLFGSFSGLVWAEEKNEEKILPFVEGQQPPEAEDGYSWCLITEPAVYKEVKKEVLISPATYYTEKIPPVYETREEQIMVSPEKRRAVYVPAEYKTETVQKLVSEKSFTYEVIPPQWEWVDETVEVSPETKEPIAAVDTYKVNRETIQVAPMRREMVKVKCVKGKDCYAVAECKAKNKTLDVEQLEQKGEETEKMIPATKATVRVRKLLKEAETRKVEIPAQYETIEKQVLVKPAEIKYEPIPAKFTTITKLVMVEPEKEKKVEIPAKYGEVAERVLESPAKMYWKHARVAAPDRVTCLIDKYKSFPCAALSVQ
jgi:hypothetical protein